MTVFGYIDKKSPIHTLTGATKLIMTLLLSIASMITYDTRFLAAVIITSCVLFALSRVSLGEIKIILSLIVVFLLINNIIIFLFSPDQGTLVYGTRHELFRIAERYSVTQEQLFYQINVTLKYFAIVPAAIVFFLTTEPGEFAASLNTLKVNYKAAYAVSLAMRYIPEVQRSYHEISQAQQARGIDISKKAPLKKRMAGAVAIVFPLVFSSMDKIQTVANALELRGFGHEKTRSWYAHRRFKVGDIAVIVLSVAAVAWSVITLAINGGRFYNPF
ncbi:MAG: energy-coupling factor transporter transmembrane protein EcfT [Clostridiales bacterium]|nr:energy-coupling factor transporter transmembrane protein EcfT [Clostridiales bacterium]